MQTICTPIRQHVKVDQGDAIYGDFSTEIMECHCCVFGTILIRNASFINYLHDITEVYNGRETVEIIDGHQWREDIWSIIDYCVSKMDFGVSVKIAKNEREKRKFYIKVKTTLYNVCSKKIEMQKAKMEYQFKVYNENGDFVTNTIRIKLYKN